MAQEASPRPERGFAQLRLYRVDPGVTVHVVSVSPTYYGLFTHWTNRGSTYCPDDDSCALRSRCQAEQIWKGYAAMLAWDERHSVWAPIVLEVTERLELDFRGRFAAGQVWRISRAREVNRKRSPVVGVLLGEQPTFDVPPEFQILPVLYNVYRTRLLRFGKDNPAQRGVTIATIAANGPAALRAETRVPESDQERTRRRESAIKAGLLPPERLNGAPKPA